MNSSLEGLARAIVNMQEEEALNLTRTLLDSGTPPVQILEKCREGIEIVGKRFEQGEYFLAELMLAGEIMTAITQLIKDRTPVEAARASKGKVVLGTVQGDIHDIGKNIVSFLLDANGFEVIDLGVDVAPDKFVEAVKQHDAKVVGMSCLLTLAYDPMRETVKALERAGLRDRVKVMIGGAATDERIREYTGADAWGKDAAEAVTLARNWLGGD